jgi:hypothetical protein
VQVNKDKVGEMRNGFPRVAWREFCEGDSVAIIFQVTTLVVNRIVNGDIRLDFCDNLVGRQQRQPMLKQDVAVASDERHAMVAEGVETQECGDFNGSGTGLVRTGSRKMADDVGSKEKFVADNGSVVRKDWLASGVFYGPNFDIEDLIHLLHS